MKIILLIEDETGICDFISFGLKEEGFSVIVKNNGKDGLEYALNKKIDLLLLDWILPGINGLEICKTVKKSKPQIPIIFLTSKNALKNTLDGLKAGAIDYIKKPFNFEELLQRVKNHLSHGMDNTTLVLGNITVDISRYEVYVNRKLVHLTQKEFDLLKYLIENKGKVCERTKIIKDVWEIGFEYDTGIIDVYINSLRKKLFLNKDSLSIRTIRGVGYISQE